MSHAVVASCQAHGFDCNTVIGRNDAIAFRKAGYSFAVRYIRRSLRAANDLSREEIDSLFKAGLAVMPVQHVQSEASWVPSDDKGRLYGSNAISACVELRIPAGTTVWLDLEGVDPSVPSEVVIRYCNYWAGRVALAGYQPGLYVGWHCGLTSDQLYSRLKFDRYWAAYNLNLDQYPAKRGVCMKQGAGKAPPRVLINIDTNLIIGDQLGGFPTVFAPDEWASQ